jgi:hypothetical protein
MNSDVKTFWERREGMAGKVVIFATLLFISYGAYIALPFILVLLSQVLYAYLMIGAILAITALVSNAKFRRWCSYAFKSFMQLLFAIDPMMVINGAIETSVKRLGIANKNIIEMKKTIGNMRNVMELNEREAHAEVALAKKCAPDSADFTLHMAQAGRLKASNEEIMPIFNQLDVAYNILMRLKERCEIEIKDLRNTASVKERQIKAVREGVNSYRSFLSAMQRDPEERYEYDRAMEQLADQIGEKVGEMEHFMDISMSLLKAADLQNEVDKDKGMKMLEEWSKSPSRLLGTSEKAKLLVTAKG